MVSTALITDKVKTLIDSYNGELDQQDSHIFMVMAAGHGKRINSSLPKVMHLMWGVPSLDRVITAAEEGLGTKNQVIIVGKKAEEVISHVGRSSGRLFAYQESLNGTGHAVQVGLEKIPEDYEGVLYTIPGDMGLLNASVLERFKSIFEAKRPSMMMLIGLYEGESEKNYYGRVVCVPNQDRTGRSVPESERGKVLAILQYQDLKAMPGEKELIFAYNGNEYSFRVNELLASRKFDAGVFAFSLRELREYIGQLKSQNVQQEIYLTDLVALFQENNLTIESVIEEDSNVLLGFNDKTVWRKMESVFRQHHYERLRNIVNIEDESRFYIDEEVIAWIENADKEYGPLDITIASGVSIGKGVKLAKGVYLGTNVSLAGNVELGSGVYLGANVGISTFPDQKAVIGRNVVLGGHGVIKGSVKIGEGARIGRGGNITGSTEFPTFIGTHSIILGSCYIFGCKIEANSHIESSILIKKQVYARKVNGKVSPIKYIIPKPVGLEHIGELD